jgi:hypothetical protein
VIRDAEGLCCRQLLAFAIMTRALVRKVGGDQTFSGVARVMITDSMVQVGVATAASFVTAIVALGPIYGHSTAGTGFVSGV